GGERGSVGRARERRSRERDRHFRHRREVERVGADEERTGVPIITRDRLADDRIEVRLDVDQTDRYLRDRAPGSGLVTQTEGLDAGTRVPAGTRVTRLGALRAWVRRAAHAFAEVEHGTSGQVGPRDVDELPVAREVEQAGPRLDLDDGSLGTFGRERYTDQQKQCAGADDPGNRSPGGAQHQPAKGPTPRHPSSTVDGCVEPPFHTT